MNKRRSLPKLTVLNRVFVAELFSTKDMGDNWGDIETHYGKIRVEDALTKQGEAHVLCHEILHAYDEILGMELGHRLMDTLAAAFMDLIQNNPEFVKYIQKAGEK